MPFIKCPECGKLNSVKLKNCPKCEASLDFARASYNQNTQQPAAEADAPMQSTPWGQTAQQPTPQPQANPWGQPAQQAAPAQQPNPWAQPSQQAAPQPTTNPWGQPAQQPVAQPQTSPWGQPAQQVSPHAVHCSACGYKLSQGARFCPKCGNPVPQIPTRKNPYFI